MNIKEKYIRICANPDRNDNCLIYIKYKNKYIYNRAEKKLFLCRNCCSFGKRNKNLGRHHTIDTIEKIKKNHADVSGENNPMYGKNHTKETINKISANKKGKTQVYVPTFLGKKHSDKTKLKMRLSAIANLQEKYRNGFVPNYNKESCRLINWINRQYNANFQHAENGGEFYIKKLGYWVDAYDAKNNYVMEIYEKQHNKTIEKDMKRKNEIINFLGCKFIEVWI